MLVRAFLVMTLLGSVADHLGISLLGMARLYRNPLWRKRSMLTDALVSAACAGVKLFGLAASR
jgi:hypothetical protein